MPKKNGEKTPLLYGKSHDESEKKEEIEEENITYIESDIIFNDREITKNNLSSFEKVALEVKKIIKFSAAFAICDIADFAGNYVGNVIVARQGGTNIIAAMALVSSERTLFFAYGLPTLFASGIMASQLKGDIENLTKEEPSNLELLKLKKAELAPLFQHSVILSIGFFTSIGLLTSFSSPALQLLQQPKELSDITQSYFRAFAPGFVAYAILIAQQQFLMGLQKQRIVIISNVINLGLTAGLDYLLVNGCEKLYIPSLGIVGLGIADSAAAAITAAITMTYIGFEKDLKDYKFLRPNFKNFSNNLKNIIKNGTPIGIQIGSDFTIAIIFTLLSGKFGKTALASLQISLQTSSLLFIAFYSISQAVGILISDYVSRKDFKSAYRNGNTALVIGTAIATIELAIIFAMPKTIISPFLSKENVENNGLILLAEHLLFIKAVGNIIDTLRNVSAGALRGYEDTRFSMIMSTSSLILVGLPIGCSLAYFTELGVMGFLSGQAISMTIPAIANTVKWIHNSRQKLLEEGTEPNMKNNEETRNKQPLNICSPFILWNKTERPLESTASRAENSNWHCTIL